MALKESLSLDKERKLALAKAVVEEEKTSYQVSKDTSVPHRSVARYAKQYVQRKELRDHVGRRPSLDDIATTTLTLYASEHPDCDLPILKRKIVEEAKKTYCRRHSINIESISMEEIPVKVSHRTMTKYIDIFMPSLRMKSIESIL